MLFIPKQYSCRACQQCLGVCPSVQGICGAWGWSPGCKLAVQNFNLFFGLAWVKFKGILALHIGWVGGRAEEQVVKGWQKCPASDSSSAKGAQHLQGSGRKSCSLLFIQAAPLNFFCFPYSPPQCSHFICSVGETPASSPYPGRNAMKLLLSEG